MGTDISAIVKCWAVLDETIKLLETAPRLGADTDNPEGMRYIQISDKLANAMAFALKEVRASEFLNLPEKG
jgi:hypothetical protein